MGEKPVIAYAQKTWKLSSGEPMHAESGYWRPKPDGTVEVVIAQSTGLVEVQVLVYFFILVEIESRQVYHVNFYLIISLLSVFTCQSYFGHIN